MIALQEYRRTTGGVTPARYCRRASSYVFHTHVKPNYLAMLHTACDLSRKLHRPCHILAGAERIHINHLHDDWYEGFICFPDPDAPEDLPPLLYDFQQGDLEDVLRQWQEMTAPDKARQVLGRYLDERAFDWKEDVRLRVVVG